MSIQMGMEGRLHETRSMTDDIDAFGCSMEPWKEASPGQYDGEGLQARKVATALVRARNV